MNVEMRAGLVILAFIASSVCGGATRKWVSNEAGDLMDPQKYDTASSVPAAGDTLVIDNANLSGDILGTFTFSGEQTPRFDTVTFARRSSNSLNIPNRMFNPGDGKIFHAKSLNFRYGDNMSILSGLYYLETLGVGNSTSLSDLTYLYIEGQQTYIKADAMNVGCGSATVWQSRANVTVSGGAVVDACIKIGMNGGWRNLMTVTGEGTCVYSTNESVIVGFRRWERVTSDTKEHVGWFHSVENCLTVADKAFLKAGSIHVSVDANSDHTATGNVMSVTGDALVDVGTLYIKGTNSVFLSDGGSIVCSDANVGFWSYDVGVGGVTIGGGSYCEVGSRSSLAATNLIQIGSVNGVYDSQGNELKVLDGGKIEAPILRIGADSSSSSGNRLTIEQGGEAIAGSFEIRATNEMVVAGVFTVTNTLNIGRVVYINKCIGGSTLTVDGGTMNMWSHDDDKRQTFYVGTYSMRSDGNRVIVKNGGEVDLRCNHFYIPASGCGNELIVTGQGSRLVHNAQTTSRNFIISAARVDTVYDTGNSVTVSDGGYLETTASMEIGNSSTNVPVYDTFLTVDQASLVVAKSIKVGMGERHVNSRLIVKGSDSRVAAETLAVGGASCIVFDLADAKSSSEALVQLRETPQFAEGSRICITSSNPGATRAQAFECKLISCAKDMDLSGVIIEIDPDSGLRRRNAGNAKVLSVAGGLRPGMVLTVR